MLKRFVSVAASIACAVMLMTGGTMVSMAEEREPLLEPVRFYGTVAEETENTILLNTEQQGEIILHISDETRILGAVDGMPIDMEDVSVGESIYAYTSPAMTLSLPPQSHAILILADIPADFKVPSLERVDDLVKESEGNYVVETVSGAEYTINKDTVTLPFLTRNMVGPESLTEGTQFLVWTTAAQPETATKIIIFAKGQLSGDNFSDDDDDDTDSPFEQISKDGWSKEDGNYYFYKDGVKQTGWILDAGSWYYLDSDTGVMQTGFIEDDGKVYYLQEDGRMLTEPRTFTPDANGVLH